jgi:hypothetical protein
LAVVQPEAPTSPVVVGYEPLPSRPERWRSAAILAAIEGLVAGAVVLAIPRLARVSIPLLSLLLPFHLCRYAGRHRVVVGLLFSGAVAVTAAVGAVWVAVHVPHRHDEQVWAAGYFLRAFASLFCISGFFSLLVSIPLTLAARRRQSGAV